MKTLLKIVGAFVALLLVVLLVAYFSLNVIVSRAITQYGPALTQTPVKVTLVTISPFDGGGRVVGLTIDSPEGYVSQPAIKLSDFKFKIDLRSLLTDKVIIQEVVMDAPEVNFEQKLTANNITQLRRNVNQYVAKMAATSGKGSRKFQIDRLVITNGKAHIGTGGAMVTFPLANTDRRHIGASSNGITSTEMTQLVFSIFTDSVLKGVASGALLKEGASSIGESIKGLFGN